MKRRVKKFSGQRHVAIDGGLPCRTAYAALPTPGRLATAARPGLLVPVLGYLPESRL